VKFRLLLVDANVVIILFKLNLWQHLLACCDVHLSKTIMRESLYWEDELGDRHSIDMEHYRQQITVHDVPASRVAALRAGLQGEMLERMDDGEAELLCVLIDSLDPYLICSGDSIVYRYIGAVRRSSQGASLEEVLTQTGRASKLDDQFTKMFKETNTQRGFDMGFTGQSFRA
jgi:hypothetical protein